MSTLMKGRNIVGGDAFIIQMPVAGDLATGDGQVQIVVPFDLTIKQAQMCLSSNGSSSGNTDIMLSVGSTDYHAAASGRIANDSSDLYKEITLTTSTLDEDDVLELDIDAVPGTTSTDLLVTLFCERRIDRV